MSIQIISKLFNSESMVSLYASIALFFLSLGVCYAQNLSNSNPSLNVTYEHDTGIEITKGDTVRIFASGYIKIGGGYDRITAAGLPPQVMSTDQEMKRYTSENYGRLMAQISDILYSIGKINEFVASKSGTLNLFLNMESYQNHSGSLKVMVYVNGIQVFPKEIEIEEGSMCRLQDADDVYNFKFSPDGALLIGSTQSYSLKIWSTKTGNLLQKYDGHTDFIVAYALSPTEPMLTSVSKDNTFIIWDVASGDKIQVTQISHVVEKAVLNPQVSKIVIPGSSSPFQVDPSVRVFSISKAVNTPENSLETTLKGHSKKVNALTFSPDGSYLVTAGEDYDINIWNTDNWSLDTTLIGHSATLERLTFINERFLASFGEEYVSNPSTGGSRPKRELKFWDLSTVEEVSFEFVKSYSTKKEIENEKLKPGHKLLAVSHNDEKILIYTQEKNLEIWQTDKYHTYFGLSSDSQNQY